jgi:DNA-binding MarR family transcriptional regulator
MAKVPIKKDSVDEIIASWHAALPDKPQESQAVFMRILHIARFYERTMEAIGRKHELSLGEVYLLLALRRAPKPLTLTQLRRELFVTAGAVSKQVDRLEAKGLATRCVVPTDARAITTTLSRAGKLLVDHELLYADQYVFRAPLDLDPAGRSRLIGELRRLVILLEANAPGVLARP